jgi:FixJ family two-component response regulator
MRSGSTPDKDAQPVVYVIDDDPSMRAALEDLLASVSLKVLSFASTHEFLNGLVVDAPGCLVLDIRMPGQSGLDFQRQMIDLGIRLPVIVITGHGDIAMSVRAMKDGAIDFLTKPFRDQDLLDAIQRGIETHRALRQHEALIAELRDRWMSLAAGEREVMELVVIGQLNKQIAGYLNVSQVTVKVRRAQVMRKMQASSLADLVRMSDKLKTSLR